MIILRNPIESKWRLSTVIPWRTRVRLGQNPNGIFCRRRRVRWFLGLGQRHIYREFAVTGASTNLRITIPVEKSEMTKPDSQKRPLICLPKGDESNRADAEMQEARLFPHERELTAIKNHRDQMAKTFFNHLSGGIFG